jgi:hypothetical protein
MDTYALEKFTGWTPELSPPEGSPLYRWRELAGEIRPAFHVAAGKMSFRGAQGANYDVQLHIGESRDSPMCSAHLRSGPSNRPGMTKSRT